VTVCAIDALLELKSVKLVKDIFRVILQDDFKRKAISRTT